MTGLRVGALTVIERADADNKGVRWFCRCDCGGTAIVQGGHLRGRRTRSCGCRRYAQGDPAPATSPLNGNQDLWQERIGYGSAHERVRALKGKATAHRCVDCGHPAREWCLRHDAAETLVGDNGRGSQCRYSTDPLDYEPRCRPCHVRYDRDSRRGGASPDSRVNDAEVGHTPAH